MKDVFKEFFASSWAIDNKTTIYVLTIIITMAGLMAYNNLPKEQFPEVIFPQIMVNTVYPGTAPADMENLVTKPLEKQVKSITGVKKITSNSIQDFSSVMVEFGTDVDVADAKQKVKDAVDKAKSDLPIDLPQQPDIMDIDISQVPIMNIHLSGDFNLDRLKSYAEVVKDKVEALKEITRVDIVGAMDREVQINVNMYKMEAANVTLTDIENAIRYENMTISGGQMTMDELKRSIAVSGEFKDVSEIGNIVIRGGTGAVVYLKDIAEIHDGFEEQESYARLAKQNVITLNVIKRSGENLLIATDMIKAITVDLQKTEFPKGLKVTMTGDQSTMTRTTLHDLINTIIIGFILVTLILMFFMGTTNAIFVGLSVPLSVAVAFIAMPMLGNTFGFSYTLNMMVLFSFLLALGIVVDDAIVVIENTHRIFDNGKIPIKTAAKIATGEVFIPVLSGTLTTLAPFVPLLAWQGVVGKFMFYLPLTLIVTLLASLLVAYIINPVFAVDFMKPHTEEDRKPRITRGLLVTVVIFVVIILLSHVGGQRGIGNFALVILALYLLNRFVLVHLIDAFQTKVWPKVQNVYAIHMGWWLQGWRPALLLGLTIMLFFLSFVLMGIFSPKVVFFPTSDPNFIYAYITLPVGTNQVKTNEVTAEVERRIYDVVGEDNPLVTSIISNVAVGANDPTSFDMSTSSHLGKVSVAFVEFAKRNGQSTSVYLDRIREAVNNIPGAEISVEQESNGPPTGKPISIEIAGENLDELIFTANGLKRYLDSLQIPGVEELKSDMQSSKPEIALKINRERANREGLSTAQIGSAVRKSMFGLDRPPKYRVGNDEIPIQIRFEENQRNNINTLLNQKIIFRDMNMGGALRQIPMSAVVEVDYQNTYTGIKRKDQKRVVTISSNVLGGFNPNEVVAQVKAAATGYVLPDGMTINLAGEQEEQQEAMSFLFTSLLISIGIIVVILVMQFNSMSKMIIIISEILFSIIGVLLGFIIFGMDISIIMTGVGIVALAGIVVRNGILLVEFSDLLIAQGMPLREAIIEAGRTRMTPVLLTAAATMLGLIPLAVGLNIDFVSLFENWDPRIFMGGDSVAFWGPLSWTMIFGLGFATFLTLLLVPALLYMTEKFKIWLGYTKKPTPENAH